MEKTLEWTDLLPFTDHIKINSFVGHAARKGTWMASLEGDLNYLSSAEGCSPALNGLLDFKNNKPPACGLYFLRVDVGNGMQDFEQENTSGYFDYIGMATAGGNYPLFQQGIFGRMYDHYRKLTCLPERGQINKLIQKYYFKITDAEQQKENRSKAIELLKVQKFKDYEELRAFLHAPHVPHGDSPSTTTEYGTTVNFQKCFQLCSTQYDLNTTDKIKMFFEEHVKVSFFIIPGSKKSKFVEKVAKGEGLAIAEYKHHFDGIPSLNQRDELTVSSLPAGL